MTILTKLINVMHLMNGGEGRGPSLGDANVDDEVRCRSQTHDFRSHRYRQHFGAICTSSISLSAAAGDRRITGIIYIARWSSSACHLSDVSDASRWWPYQRHNDAYSK